MKREFHRFLLVGVANTLLVWVVYWGMLRIATYQVSFATAFVAGMVFSAFAHSRLSFGLRMRLAGFLSYFGYCVFLYAVSSAALEFFVGWAGVPAFWGNVAVTAVSVPLNFIGSRWVMGRHADRAD